MSLTQTKYLWNDDFDTLQSRINKWIDEDCDKELGDCKHDEIIIKDIKTGVIHNPGQSNILVWACIIYEMKWEYELD